MHAYRFRILNEDQDNFVRDIDILANQTFQDFHQAFIDMFNLKNDELASFYICDSRWIRLKELTLIDMRHDEIEETDDEDSKDMKTHIPVSVMKDVKIKDAIDDPHQRLIYEYDFLNSFVFYIELIKIIKSEEGKTYPLVVRSVGDFVRTPSHRNFVIDDLKEDLLTSEDDILDDTFEVENEDFDLINEPEW
ncbi:MAG TPA: hypothetical protein PK908_07960 [Bacteroidales bacterium]|nr:hypothetical protein [Bacteroidales bacterium]